MQHANNKNNNGLSLRGIRIIFTFPYILFYIFKSCAETDFFFNEGNASPYNQKNRRVDDEKATVLHALYFPEENLVSVLVFSCL